MTKDEFIAYYCSKSTISWIELGLLLEPVPCDCEMSFCHGWTMETHKDEEIE